MCIKKIALSGIAVIIVLLTIFTLPIQVMAESVYISESYETPTQKPDSTYDETDSTQGSIIGEDTAKRDEFTKYFITDAGTTIAAQYAVPVHFKDDSGEYVDYDNSLESSQIIVSDSTIDEATEDEVSSYSLRDIQETPQTEEILVNKKSNAKVSHYKKSGKANLIQIERDGHTISWGYSGANIVSAKEQENKATENLTGNDAYLALPNLSSTILYENIYNNVNLEVINSTTGVKENLILKASNVKNVFKIEYSIGELSAESVDSHTIELKDTLGEVVYTISAPYMKDAYGEISEALELKILSNNKGRLSVKLTADKTWLKDKTRVYPVTIDPWFTYGQDWGVVESTFINENEPSESYGVDGTSYQGSLYVGRPDADSKLRRSLIKIVNPETSIPLNNSDMIVGAQIALAQVTDDLTETIYVGVYEAKSSWTQGTATWSYPPNCSSELIDYEKIPAGTQAWRYWDVTELVKKWYNGGTNYGMYLKAINEGNVGQGLQFTSASNPEDVGYRPFFVLVYRNNKGLEDRWSYTAIDCGRAGTAYINDYSGNLVFNMPLASTASPIMSAGLSYIYNSYYAGQKYKDSYPYTGRGWKMNLQQTVHVTTDAVLGDNQADFPYVYTDVDGTEHYFCPKVEDGVTKYYDEDGLNLELQVTKANGKTTYLIINKDDEKYHFNEYGNLSKIENKAGQSITINYSGKQITSIVDAEGNTITFTVNDTTNNYVKKITDSDGKVTTVTFTGSKIGGITYNDGKSISFTYDDAGKLLSVTDVDGAKVVFTYSSNGSKGVTSVTEYGKNGTQGQKMTFDRTKYNTTTIRTPGVDGVYGNSNDMLTIYQFDNWGKTVSVNCQLSSGSNIGAGAYTYTASEVDSTGSNIKKLNRISSNFSLGANRENIVKNHNMETLATDGTKIFSDWSERYWIANTVDFDVVSNTNLEKVLYGQKSMKLTVNSASGDARGRVYQNIDAAYLTQGTTYTLSAYVKTENIVPVSGAEDYGALICITPLDSDDNTKDIYSEHISQDTDEDINKGFRRISITFEVPDSNEFTGVRIQLALRAATGTVYFDAVQLEKASYAPSAYNMLENASFERTVTNALPENWSTKTLSTNDKKSSKSTAHRHEKLSITFKGAVNDKQNVYQDVPVSGTEADTYILSGWAKAPSVPSETNSSCFELRVKIYYADGTDTTKYSAKFNTTISDWQFSSFAFNLDNKDGTEDTPTKIGVYLIYYYQGNSVLFDNIQLTKEPVPSYTYDDEGNLISVVANAQQDTQYTYTDDLLTKYTDTEDKDYSYTYYDNKLLKSVTTPTGLQYGYTYDSKGNVTSVKAAKGGMYLTEDATYNYANGGDTYSVTTRDQRGFGSTSVFDADNGNLISTTDRNGYTTTRSYNASNNKLTGIVSGDQSVSYAYTDDYKHLFSITHGNTMYRFLYDEFGNNTITRVGTRNLAEYTYGANNGYLNKVTYGNGFTESYTYDNYGNKKTISRNGTKVAQNYTDASGNIIRSTDYINNLEYRAGFDSLGRLAYKDVFDLTATGTNDKWSRSVEYQYDKLNNISKLSLAYSNGTSNTVHYMYNTAKLPSTVILPNNKNVNYNYDELNRLTSTSINATTPINAQYTYMPTARGSSLYTTNLISTEVTDAFAYSYIYDLNGNITKIQNGTKQSDGSYTYGSSTGHWYTYDQYNQLTGDLNYDNATVTYYTYDTNGNITYKITRDWNIAANAPMGVLDSHSYKYEDTKGWGDLLTSWSGQTITYDGIGNPLNYRDGITMTWQNGRELASFENDDVTVNYTYDTSGLRTQKAVTGGITTKYIYEGGLLVRMSYGSSIFDFNYDANDRPIGFKYSPAGATNGTYYYYGVNSRGDIEALYNGSGIQIASYSYDAYGKPISTNTLLGGHSTVIAVQPLRYRGYVYDTETGLYYLQSRYYDPTTCRFINGDSQLNTNDLSGFNQFAYCNNNPIISSDPCGHKPGDYFGSIDAAMRDFAKTYNIVSIQNNWEYATFIYTIEVDVYVYNNNYMTSIMYSYCEPWTDYMKSCVYMEPDNNTADAEPAALAHTHAAYSWRYDGENFSPEDKQLSKEYELDIFVATPSGQIKKYELKTDTTITIYGNTFHDRRTRKTGFFDYHKCNECAN